LAFKKAMKYEAKGRVALIGPAGSGKSFTALTIARLLAGKDGKIAAIDTEHGSLSKYADLFDFDVIELSSFSYGDFMEPFKAAEKAGYSVFLCDSLSHFWMGTNGALEFVDAAARTSRDQMAGWKQFRPYERQMMDAIIGSPMHVICTMRTKTAYEESVNPTTGKKQRVKIGLAPVQRDGMEFEFDLVGSMDEDNTFIVDKTRCSAYAGKALTKPTDKAFEPFRDWLSGTKPEPPAPVTTPPPVVEMRTATHRQLEASEKATRPPLKAEDILVVSGNQVQCRPVEVLKAKAKSGRPYLNITLNGDIPWEGGMLSAGYCYDTKLFDILVAAVDMPCVLEWTVEKGFLKITDVIKMAGQEYHEGQPVPPPNHEQDDILF
jgi:hypothetical protein